MTIGQVHFQLQLSHGDIELALAQSEPIQVADLREERIVPVRKHLSVA